MKKLFIPLLLTVCLFAQSEPVEIDWEWHYCSQNIPSDDIGTAVTVDQSGNIYVAGKNYKLTEVPENVGSNPELGLTYTIIKYNSNGSEVWHTRLDDFGINTNSIWGNYGNDLLDIKADSIGNVFCALRMVGDIVFVKILPDGTVDDYGKNILPNERWDSKKFVIDDSLNIYFLNSRDIIKYNSDGTQEWTNIFGTADGDGSPISLLVDQNGYLYIIGSSSVGLTGRDFLTIKYNPDGTKAWEDSYCGYGASWESPTSIALDQDGNVYVAGEANTGLGPDDFVTIKYNPDGTKAWVSIYDGPYNSSDYMADLQVDQGGYVYVTGWCRNEYSYDVATIKYNPDGTEAWASIYNGPFNVYDHTIELEVDQNGNVFVIGESRGDYITIKYDPDGSEEWASIYNGPDSGSDSPNAFVIDQTGNIIVTGGSYSVYGSYDFATVMYNPDGTELWVNRYDGPSYSDDFLVDMSTDEMGNIYVCSNSNGGIKTSKLSPNGTEVWGNQHVRSNSLDVYCKDLVIDQNGNVFVLGGISDDYNYTAILTIKYNSSGTKLWVNQYSNDNETCRPIALTTDQEGNIYITGYNSNEGTMVFVTIKYNPDGSEAWISQYSGPDDTWNNIPSSIVVDQDGYVYVTGSSDNNDVSNYVTVKYDPNGTEEWISLYDGPGNRDYPSAIAVDQSGCVYITGSSYGVATNSDFATIKYNSNGTEEWVNRYDGPDSCWDKPSAIAVDNIGNVFVTGTNERNGDIYSITTIMYNSDGTEAWINQYDNSNYNWAISSSIVLDQKGDIYIVIGGHSPVIRFDQIATVKYKSDGSLGWEFTYNNPDAQYIAAGNLLVDTEGNVLLTGTIIHDYCSWWFKKSSSISQYDKIWGDWVSELIVLKIIQPMGQGLSIKINSPVAYSVHQNYPNPFNPTTTISYDLPKSSVVTLSIYDISGRVVETLVNQRQAIGNYQVLWDASNYSSGVYFYKIQTDGFQQVRKMLLVK